MEKASTHFVDQSPEIALCLPFVPLLLPNARVIYMRRHPLAICFSWLQNAIEPDRCGFTNEFHLMKEAFIIHDRARKLARDILPEGMMLEVFYEELVENSEAEIRKMLQHIDMPWDENCLHPEENKGPVTTPSARQVRKGINRLGVEKWLNYKSFLEENLLDDPAFKLIVDEFEAERQEYKNKRSPVVLSNA